MSHFLHLHKKLTEQAWFHRAVAEVIGTFLLVFGGTAAVLATSMGFVFNGDVIIGLAFGLSLMIGVFSLGHISGAHFNPAVTVGLWLGKHFPKKEVLPYIGAQVIGATLASLLLWIGFHGAPGFTTGPTVPSSADFAMASEVVVFIFELVGTAILAFVIASVATDKRASGVPAGLAIGGTLMMLALATGWIGGGSFNPARTFGPALIGGVWNGFLIYMIAPVLGGIAGVQLSNYVRK